MGFWTNKQHRTALDDAEDLANAPEGGPLKMWLVGAGLALVPLCYGACGLWTGETTFFGGRGGSLELHGPAAVAMSIAYISVGAFIHFHWFWGLHPRLRGWSQLFKTLAVLVFLGSFAFTIYRVLA